MLKTVTEFLDFIAALAYIVGHFFLGMGVCTLLAMTGIAVIEFLGVLSLMGLQLVASELGCTWFMELTSKVVSVAEETTYLMTGPRFIGSATVLGVIEVLFLVWVTLPDPEGEDIYR